MTQAGPARSVRRAFLLAGTALSLAVGALVAGGLPRRRRRPPSPVNGTQGAGPFDGIWGDHGGGGKQPAADRLPGSPAVADPGLPVQPGYGADLQILKVEIGGDTNSTDGSESSIEHASGSINCSAGYNWWLMEQAKALNPNIKLYGWAWGRRLDRRRELLSPT